MNISNLSFSSRQNEPLFDRKLVVGSLATAGFVLAVIMRSKCNAALQACPECISLGMPIECRIADAISILAIAILGMTTTVLTFQVPSRPELPV